jgi:hypothetical protein
MTDKRSLTPPALHTPRKQQSNPQETSEQRGARDPLCSYQPQPDHAFHTF